MSFKHHVIFTSAPSVGHVRPSMPIIVKMVQERPDVLVTVPVIGSFKALIDKEVARYCTGSNSVLRDNIRVTQISDFDGFELDRWANIMTAWPVFFAKLWSCEPIVCCTGQIYPSAPRPSLCILDGTLGYPLGESIINEKKLKVLVWTPVGLSAVLNLLGPSELGGRSDSLERDAPALAKSKNISIHEAKLELVNSPTEKVTKIAGLPAAYHYEFESEHGIPGGAEYWINHMAQLSRFARNCDGALLSNTPILEEGAVTAFKQWFDGMGKRCYAVGPCTIPDLTPFDHGETLKEKEVMKFLDDIYETHGKRSLLYMSFGTSSFPSGKTPWQLIAIILELKIPLIFTMAHGNSYEKELPDDFRTRLESSDLTLVTKWAPQQTILNHTVTGVFLTHGGHGGLTESLLAGIIPIIWPLQGDQAFNCMNFVLNLKVAYQLLEVRTGKGLLPLYRGYCPTGTGEAIDREFRQVLGNAFGVDGEAKREIIQELSKKLKETWRENGEALTELRRMLQENF